MNYIIVNADKIQERIDELKNELIIDEQDNIRQYAKIRELVNILSNSIPLIPEIEKAFDVGRTPTRKRVQGYGGRKHIEIFTFKEDYISQLKFD